MILSFLVCFLFCILEGKKNKKFPIRSYDERLREVYWAASIEGRAAEAAVPCAVQERRVNRDRSFRSVMFSNEIWGRRNFQATWTFLSSDCKVLPILHLPRRYIDPDSRQRAQQIVDPRR